jgi:hypothetical protein
MSKPEDETPPPEEESFSTDDLTFAEPGAETTPAAEAPAEAAPAGEPADFMDFTATEGMAAEAEPAAEPAEAGEQPAAVAEEGEKGEEGEEGEKPKKKSPDWPFHLQWIIALAVCVVICLVFVFAHVAHAPWHAGYLISLVVLVTASWMTRKIWAQFEVTALYTMALAGALAALLTGVYCLGLEMSNYNWDLKAKAGRPPAVAKGENSPSQPAAQPQPRPEPPSPKK